MTPLECMTSTPLVPPTMPGRAVLGSAADLRRDLLGTQLRAHRTLGEVVRFRVGPSGVGRVLHSVYAPEGVQRVLASASARYRKDNRFYAELRRGLGDGLLTSQDDVWQRQRRFLQPHFTPAQVRRYVDGVSEEVTGLVERWHAPSRTGEPVELYGELSRFTVRVVGRLLFGIDLEDAVLLVRDALPTLTEHVRRRGYAPWSSPATWPTPANREAARARRALDDLIEHLVGARRASGVTVDDLMGRLLGARDGGDRLTDDEVRDQILIFLLAGTDTTAVTLTFALHLLGRHPQVQQLAFEEVRDVLGGRAPTAASLESLGYLSTVVKETLRLYPPAYATGRRLVGGDDEVCGYRVPEGADVAVFPWVTHRHPRHWDDPETFDPLRFTPEREAARHRYAWFPFGGGPRACIGGHLAWLESLAALGALLANYRVATSAEPVPLVPRVTLQPAAPMWCSISPR
jgi:cytochrome P450